MTRRMRRARPVQSCIVVAIETRSASRLDRLSTLGVTPGIPVTLEQRRPAFVLRVGFTELSIEREVADEILVDTS